MTKGTFFPFPIVSFPHLPANIHFVKAHGVLTSQLVRFARGCDLKEDFLFRVKNLFLKLCHQGFSQRLLKSRCRRFMEKYHKSYGLPVSDFMMMLNRL